MSSGSKPVKRIKDLSEYSWSKGISPVLMKWELESAEKKEKIAEANIMAALGLK